MEGSRVVSVPTTGDSTLGAVHEAEFLGVTPGGEGKRGVGSGLGVLRDGAAESSV